MSYVAKDLIIPLRIFKIIDFDKKSFTIHKSSSGSCELPTQIDISI